MRSNTVVSHFWKWFVKHNKEYLKPPEAYAKGELKYMINKIEVHLGAYSKWLFYNLFIAEKQAKVN